MGATRRARAGHVIVCGLNDLGLSIVEQLDAAGVDAVVVEDRDLPGPRRRLERLGVPLIIESAEAPEALRAAGIDSALALVACRDTDLENLRICFVAADSAPRTRIVASIDNPQLRGPLRDAFDQVRVRSVGDLAGPGFVEACVWSAVIHAFTLDGPAATDEIFAVVGVDVTTEAPFRALYGDLTPISLRRAGEPTATTCPPRDVPVSPGDRLVVLGRLTDLRAHGLAVDEVDEARLFASLTDGGRRRSRAETPAPGTGRDTSSGPVGRAGRRGRRHEDGRGRRREGWQAGQTRRERLRVLAATVRVEVDRPFRRALAAVAAVIAVSTVVLALTYRDNNPAAPPTFDTLDALYLTAQTMVTVGYGDYNFAAADTWLQVFGIVLMVVGAVSVAVVYAFITNVIISRRLERALGLGRAGTVRDHVIVCGLGSVGLATMEGLLRVGRRVVVIERDAANRFLPVAREHGVPVVIGDATVPSTLLQAGLERAATISAVTGDGHTNLEAVLSARQARAAVPLRVVTRVFDATMSGDAERRFGIHTARSAAALAAPHFLAAALDHEVVSAFYVDRTPFLVARMTVPADGGLVGRTLAELAPGTRVLAVSRPAKGAGPGAGPPDYHPGPHTRLRAADELLVVGPVAQIIAMI